MFGVVLELQKSSSSLVDEKSVDELDSLDDDEVQMSVDEI